MYVIIENIALFGLVLLGLTYITYSPGLLMRKLLVFVLTASAYFAIQMVTNLVNKVMFSLNDLILRSLQTGMIGTLGFSIMIDMFNENIIRPSNIIDISTNKYATTISVVVSNIIATLITILMKTNYRSI